MPGIELQCDIKKLLQWDYVIPLYQRNYAWGEEEIYQLLQDIYESYKKSNGTGQYFIGSLVVLKRRDGSFEVIDGQQRLTTISLIAKILYPSKYNVPKLHFDSRPEVEAFLQSFYSTGQVIDTTNSHLVSHFKEAVDIINTADLEVKEEERLTIPDLITRDHSFIDYFFNNVIIVKVEIPNDTDVAHYFEVMNNRGEQLEKHEILKARLLDVIRKDNGSSLVFSKVWDACSQMNTPIQKLFSSHQRKSFFGENYGGFHWNVEEDEEYTDKNNLTIKKILAGESINRNDENEDNEINLHYSSILDFPNFLMHVLRLKEDEHNVEVPLNGDELLDTFEKVKNKIDPRLFIKDLLFYKIVFDRFIVKTFDDENEEDNYKWVLRRPTRNNNPNRLEFVNSFQDQDKIIKCLSMLQVTFRTKKYKTWLQTILSWFKNSNSLDISRGEYIKKLNQLVLNRYNRSEFSKVIDNEESYRGGTKTPHYLFNFLDYLIWSKYPGDFKFEFKFRNSVEHHLPQSSRNPKNFNFIDHFGNLCLVSKGGNSKMNNENPIGKAVIKDGKYYKETLPPKQKLMYDLTNYNKEWSEPEIQKHYDEMLEILVNRESILEYE